VPDDVKVAKHVHVEGSEVPLPLVELERAGHAAHAPSDALK
jgi:hypothetical protein